MRYYVTTGTSLSQESRCWFSKAELDEAADNDTAPIRDTSFDHYHNLLALLDEPNPQPKQIFQYINRVRSRAAWLTHPDSGWDENLNEADYKQQAADRVAEYFDLECWDIRNRHLLSAELSTILVMSVFGGNGVFSEEHELHLIGGESNRSDTVLSWAVLKRVASDGIFAFDPERITCSYSRHLDPINHPDFAKRMDELWQNVQPTRDDPNVSFVLTGGYKGVGLAIASRIKSESTDYYYLHEKADLSEREGYGLVIMNINHGIQCNAS